MVLFFNTLAIVTKEQMAGLPRLPKDISFVLVQATSMVEVFFWSTLCTAERCLAILFEERDFLLSRKVALVALPYFNDHSLYRGIVVFGIVRHHYPKLVV